MVERECGYQPRFDLDSQGKATAAMLEVRSYIALLVRANVTDSELWPPGFRQGAAALDRVRKIEADSAAEMGQFDWEKLPPDLQDEYDLLTVQLDRLQAGNDDSISWNEFIREKGGT